MTLSNHMIAGAGIAITISNPIVAVIISLVSHYIMDALPHFGYKKGGYQEALRHKMTIWVIAVSLIHAAAIVWVLLNGGEVFALACAFVALSPDVIGATRYFMFEKHNKEVPVLIYVHAHKLHKPIQTLERPWGIIPEIIFAVIVTMFVWSSLS